MITAPNPQPDFACDNLSIGYRNAEGRMTDVLVDVTLTLQPGGTLGIVGESGSGKSTLARALLGHLRPGSRVMGGSLSVLGTDMFGAAPRTVAAMRGTAEAIAMKNPLTSLTYHMTAGDQVMEVLKYRAGKSPADARQIMLDLFHEVGLPEPETARNDLGRGVLLRALFWFASYGPRAEAKKRRVTYRYLFMHPSGAELAELARLIDEGKLEPVIDRVFSFDEIADAFAYLEAGHAKGKVVVRMVDSPA